MPVADLSRTATLEGMVRLTETGSDELLERPGAEPTTQAEEFEGRNGYQSGFLNGWNIPLPSPTGPMLEDVRHLRRGGSGYELKYRNFSVVLSASRRLPIITAANIDAQESRRIGRTDIWRFDGRLDKADQWGDELYFKRGLDRGHMVRREDPVWGSLESATEANADTFHFTNCCPQMPGVNQQTWHGLEDYILHHARADGMRVTVFTGPYFTADDLDHVSGAKIPLAFWKVVAIVTDAGRPSATAYEVSQARELSELEFVYAGYKTFQISIQQVIDRTSLDFSALVPYDGFSQHEAETGETLAEVLDTLEAVRI